MKGLFVFIFSLNAFAADELHLKFKVPNTAVADFAERYILKNCQPFAQQAVELLVHDYRYRKMVDSNGQVTLLHDVVVMFDYQSAYEDFVVLTIAEHYPNSQYFLKSIQDPDICLHEK